MDQLFQSSFFQAHCHDQQHTVHLSAPSDAQHVLELMDSLMDSQGKAALPGRFPGNTMDAVTQNS